MKQAFVLILAVLLLTGCDTSNRGLSTKEWEAGKRVVFSYKGADLACWVNTYRGALGESSKITTQANLSCDYQSFYMVNPSLRTAKATLQDPVADLTHLNWQGWELPCITLYRKHGDYGLRNPATSCDYQAHKEAVPYKESNYPFPQWKGFGPNNMTYQGRDLNCAVIDQRYSTGGKTPTTKRLYTRVCDFETFYSNNRELFEVPQVRSGQAMEGVVWTPWNESYLPCVMDEWGTACDWILYYKLNPQAGLEPSFGEDLPRAKPL